MCVNYVCVYNDNVMCVYNNNDSINVLMCNNDGNNDDIIDKVANCALLLIWPCRNSNNM
jgi:hypothetical protein